MKRLSSPKPPKYFVPLIFLGLVSIVLLMAFIPNSDGEPTNWGQILFIVALSIIIPFLMYRGNERAVKGIVDEVWDCGDNLLVRHEGVETRYPLAKCVDVFCFFERPPGRCVSITVERDNGKIASFMFLYEFRSDDVFRFWKHKNPALVSELKQRIAAARHSHAQQ